MPKRHDFARDFARDPCLWIPDVVGPTIGTNEKLIVMRIAAPIIFQLFIFPEHLPNMSKHLPVVSKSNSFEIDSFHPFSPNLENPVIIQNPLFGIH
jgi:hypothetical protein